MPSFSIKAPFMIPSASDTAGIHQFTVEHALSCSHGGYPSIRHNELHDITAELMSEVCHNVGIKPSLQPVTDEHLVHRTANRKDGARLDVAAESFWVRN